MKKTFKEHLEELTLLDPIFTFTFKVVESNFSKGKGGQNVNRHLNGYRLFHEESGIVVAIHDERSLPQNKEKACKIMAERLSKYYQQKIIDHFGKPTYKCKDQIRTYNYKRNECHDHRTGCKVELQTKGILITPDNLDKLIDDCKQKL